MEQLSRDLVVHLVPLVNLTRGRGSFIVARGFSENGLGLGCVAEEDEMGLTRLEGEIEGG